MTNRLQKNSMLVHRSVILDGLRALYITQFKMDQVVQEDPFAVGFKEGFDTALLSIAEMMGVSDEFETSRRRIGTQAVDDMRLISS